MNYPDREARVSRSFVTLAATLVQDYDVVDLLDQIVVCGVELLAADAVGILLGDVGGRLRVAAASGEDAALQDLLALDDEDNPCVECFRAAAPVRVPDLAQVRSRWPEFAVAVDRAGAFRSVHALPLRLNGVAVGVLVLFHNTPGLLPADDLALVQALADTAAIGVVAEGVVRRGHVGIEQLQTVLAGRVVIEHARGVVAQRCGLGVDEASALLGDHAYQQHQRLSELARQIVSRELDPASWSADRPVLDRLERDEPPDRVPST